MVPAADRDAALGRRVRCGGVILNSGLRHFWAGANLDAMLKAAGHGDGRLDWPTLELLRAFDELPIPIVATGGPTVAHAAKFYLLQEVSFWTN